MMDSVVVDHYRKASGEKWLAAAWEDERRAAKAGRRVMGLFRDDLLAAGHEIREVVVELEAAGFVMTPVRIVELLVWTETEAQGYYRDGVATPPTVSSTRAKPAHDTGPASPVGHSCMPGPPSSRGSTHSTRPRCASRHRCSMTNQMASPLPCHPASLRLMRPGASGSWVRPSRRARTTCSHAGQLQR